MQGSTERFDVLIHRCRAQCQSVELPIGVYFNQASGLQFLDMVGNGWL